MSDQKTLYLSGRLRPGGINLANPLLKSLTTVTDENGAVTVTLPLMATGIHPAENRLQVLLLPTNQTWASREPFKSKLLSPALDILSSGGGTASARVTFSIPEFPDWKKSTLKSSIDGSLFIVTAATDLTGTLTDRGSTLLKTVWSYAPVVNLQLPTGSNTDFIWIEHEYLFGGIINSLATPLPPSGITTTSTTTTTTSGTTTTTTGATTTTTNGNTTTTSTYPPATTGPEPSGAWVALNTRARVKVLTCPAWYSQFDKRSPSVPNFYADVASVEYLNSEYGVYSFFPITDHTKGITMVIIKEGPGGGADIVTSYTWPATYKDEFGNNNLPLGPNYHGAMQVYADYTHTP